MITPAGDTRATSVVSRAIAAISGGATPDELAAVVELPLVEVVDAVVELVDAGLLIDRGHALRFVDEAARDAVLAGTPPSVRRAIARRAAAVLTERGADPERIAACVLTAADPRSPGDVDRLVEVGRRLRDSHPAAAADLLQTALTTMPARDARATDVVLDLAWALVGDGRAAEVDALLDSRLGPYHADEARPVQRVRNVAACLGGRLDVVLDRVAHIDPAGLDVHYDRFDPDAVDAVAELALLWAVAGRIADAAAVAAWVDASPTAPNPFRSSTIAQVTAWRCAVAGRFEEAAAHARRALDHAERDPRAAATGAPPALLLAVSLDQLGSGDDALAVARGRALTTAVPRWGPPLLQFFSAITLWRRGAWDDALAESAAGLDAARRMGIGMTVFWPCAVRALVAVARGDRAAAAAALDEARAATPAPGLGGEWLLYASALLDEASGNLERAVTTAELVVAAVEAAGAPALLLNGGPDLARIALAGGRGGVAKQVCDALQSMTTATESPIVAALAMWADGLLLADSVEITQAAVTLTSCGRLPEAARATHDAALLAAAVGDIDAARRLAGEAIEAYDRLGAEEWRRQLEAGLRATGVGPAPRRRAAARTGWGSLTAAESAVVDLLASGMSNAAIAERLYVSRRTVESHLRRVYAKLDIASRTELVAAAARRDAHDPSDAPTTA